MKKILLGLALIIILALVIWLTINMSGFIFKDQDTPQKEEKTDYQNITYIINGTAVTLRAGVSETSLPDGSAAKIITRYFGNEARGDFNNDGQEDIAFLLTQDSGGSGLFYYLAVALAEADSYTGLKAILLGDRIAPQTTEFRENKIIVNYADRLASEPMTTAPSVGVSRYFQVISGELTEIDKPTALANPASTNCLSVGGQLHLEKRGDGGDYGLCYFEDNRACEEWALFRGDCPTGGVKTTGFETIEQKYCAWSGGTTLAVPEAICTFKNGSACSAIDFYTGRCLPSAD